MERLPYPPSTALLPELPTANMLRMLTHSPATLHPVLALGTACLSQISIPEALREVLALFCGIKFQSKYVWSRHIKDAVKRGVTVQQLDALQNRNFTNCQVWNERDIAFLRFLDEVIDLPAATDQTFLEARKWFDERQIVEIIIAQGFYYMWSRVSTTIQVDIDEEVPGDYEKAQQWAALKNESSDSRD
ncbi:AhpD-like protein [Aspergillus granulosus]|uniref:AhpD-like protein n=1 Tax=Aspergillus granulosus TaxID=176169 RepID=A0ABR4GRY9_9EURO